MRKVLAIAVLSGAVSASLMAGPIYGTFTIDGSVTVETDGTNGCTSLGGCITWTSNDSVANEATISALGLTGSFVGLADQTVTINNLMDSPTGEPVNTPFPNYDFLNFDPSDDFPNLLANFISAGSGNPANCSTNTANAMAGQTCTLNASTVPAEPGGSPFTFLNTLNGDGVCCNSTATWDISGITSDNLSSWDAVLTADFTAPAGDPAVDGSFQEVLNDFLTNGQDQDAFAGAFTITVIPEPGTWAMMGSGLLLLMGMVYRRRRKAA